MSKVGVFVDVTRQYNKEFRINYQKYLAKAKGNMELHRAIAYGVQMHDEANDFIIALRKIGYLTRYRQAKMLGLSFICQECKAENTPEREKASIIRTSSNVQLTIDVMNNLIQLDQIVLGTNDVDLIPLINWVMGQGVKVILFSQNIPTELANIVDETYTIGKEIID